jgi:hypothetical protein
MTLKSDMHVAELGKMKEDRPGSADLNADEEGGIVANSYKLNRAACHGTVISPSSS